MKNLLIFLLRFILSLRYRVEVDGLDAVEGLERTLVLPNHPAYIDPPLVIGALWFALRPRPMLLARIFRNPLLFWMPRALNALEVPDLDRHSVEARAQTEKTIDAVVEGLRRGENFVLWPSGRVQRHDREVLGSTRSVAEIVSRVPDLHVVLVRTRGLRGSLFSYARTGVRPNLAACLLESVAILAANAIFFTPRRRVHLTVERLDRESLPGSTREELNPFLEAWYNEPGIEPPTFVPYHAIFGRRTFEFPAPPSGFDDAALGDIPAETKAAVAEIVAEKAGAGSDDDALRDATTHLDALGLDSLDRMELSLSVEERFGFRGGEVPETIGDLWALAEGLAESGPPKPPPESWFRAAEPDEPAAILGHTIPDAFVRRALASRRDVVAADDLSGVLTYERFLVGAQAMARALREIAAPQVGVLLPAAVATDLVLYAVQLAGKTPVLLNWTTGPANLAHAAETMELTHVVTSKKLIDRLALTVEGMDYLFLEDLRRRFGKLELLCLLLRNRLTPRSVLRGVPDVSPDDTAVVLFTSGSEKAPKAVPLTHANLLGNLDSVLKGYDLRRRDVILGFLPTFHSFGLTLTSLLPTLSGCRVVHHPDPTDAGALVRKLTSYRATIVCATPTFLGHLLKRMTFEGDDSERPTSLRWAVLGGEKAPDSIFEQFSRLVPDAELMEGYGVTECSPLVCCNRPGKQKRGTIGAAIPGVELEIVDPDSFDPLPRGEVGLLLVSGANVFPGYLGYEGPSPFHERDGKRWYITGDLARADDDGFYHFAGRLKRFLKAGGEMISLPAMEEPIAARYPPEDDGPRVAVEGVDDESKRRIVLFTTEPIELRDANGWLVDAGFRGVMRFDEVRRVDSIPVLGTGKIDYKVLRRQLVEEAKQSGSRTTRPTPDIGHPQSR